MNPSERRGDGPTQWAAESAPIDFIPEAEVTPAPTQLLTGAEQREGTHIYLSPFVKESLGLGQRFANVTLS